MLSTQEVSPHILAPARSSSSFGNGLEFFFLIPVKLISLITDGIIAVAAVILRNLKVTRRKNNGSQLT